MALSPHQPKVAWSVYFRHAKMGMLMLNMGSKLVAIVVICVLVGTTRDSGSEEPLEGTNAVSSLRSRRALREIVNPTACPFDFSETAFPLTLSLCTRPDVWSDSCCAAIRSDFWVPTFGADIENIPEDCISAVESRLLQEQLRIKYSAVCGPSGSLSDPLMRQGQRSDVAMQTAPRERPQFEVVVSQLLYSEESVEEIPSDTRPLEEGEEELLGSEVVGSPVLRRTEASGLGGEGVSGTEIQPFVLRRKGKRQQSNYDFESIEPLTVNDMDLHKLLPIASL